MTAATLTLADFLLARIAEDEAFARTRDFISRFVREELVANGTVVNGMTSSYDGEFLGVETERMLAECKAKRRIVEGMREVTEDRYEYSGWINFAEGPLRALAAVYADHPDYNPAWT